MPSSVQIKALVPIWVQRLLDHVGGTRLLAIDGGHGERVGET